jgi:hypothetical protein
MITPQLLPRRCPLPGPGPRRRRPRLLEATLTATRSPISGSNRIPVTQRHRTTTAISRHPRTATRPPRTATSPPHVKPRSPQPKSGHPLRSRRLQASMAEATRLITSPLIQPPPSRALIPAHVHRGAGTEASRKCSHRTRSCAQCPRCNKTVYFAEAREGPNNIKYHKMCFTCITCSKVVDSQYNERQVGHHCHFLPSTDPLSVSHSAESSSSNHPQGSKGCAQARSALENACKLHITCRIGAKRPGGATG